MVLCVGWCVPFFSMASTRFTRVWGAVSGGVNCSVKSRRETSETTQMMVTFSDKTLKTGLQEASIDIGARPDYFLSFTMHVLFISYLHKKDHIAHKQQLEAAHKTIVLYIAFTVFKIQILREVICH